MQKDLTHEEALSKLKDLAESIKVCMFMTESNGTKAIARPMTTIDIGDDGSLWFFTNISSEKVTEMETNQKVHLTYADPGKENYMDLWGYASTSTDKELIKDKWSPIVKAWFPDGVDDPNIALISVTPEEAYYWDTKSGKMVAFLKMAAAAVTGKKADEGVSGKLEI